MMTLSMQPCPVIHLFPMFPPEIQLKIWRRAFTPRLVSIRFDAEAEAYTSNASIPAVLSTCKQSRDEARRFYELTFANKTDRGRVWVNFDIDTVLFMNSADQAYELPHLTKFLSETKGVEKIKMLAMEEWLAEKVSTSRCVPSNRRWIWEVLFPAMRNLEKIFEVFHTGQSHHLADGASGYVMSFKKHYKVPSNDLSLVRNMWEFRCDRWFAVEDLTAEQELDTAQNARGRKDMNRIVVWSNWLFNYRNLPIIVVSDDFEPESIMPIVQINKLEGFQDPTIFGVVDDKFVRRPFINSLKMHPRCWNHKLHQLHIHRRLAQEPDESNNLALKQVDNNPATSGMGR